SGWPPSPSPAPPEGPGLLSGPAAREGIVEPDRPVLPELRLEAALPAKPRQLPGTRAVEDEPFGVDLLRRVRTALHCADERYPRPRRGRLLPVHLGPSKRRSAAHPAPRPRHRRDREL